MLSRETMGCLALGILWVNVLLIAAAAAKQLRALLARRASLAGAAPGRVLRGDGPGGALAEHRVEQIGRAAIGADAILFHDRAASGQVFGGTVALDGGSELAVPPSAAAEVWVDGVSLRGAVACASDEAFEPAYASASRAKGFVRTVAVTVGEGARVFVLAPRGGAVLVASMEPRVLLATKAALGAAFIAAALIAAAACTALALRPPVFGPVSTGGGVLGLALFLLVQPAGTRVRDAMLVPSRTPVRGRWAKARARGEGQ
jgi:hypothetical protein